MTEEHISQPCSSQSIAQPDGLPQIYTGAHTKIADSPKKKKKLPRPAGSRCQCTARLRLKTEEEGEQPRDDLRCTIRLKGYRHTLAGEVTVSTDFPRAAVYYIQVLFVGPAVSVPTSQVFTRWRKMVGEARRGELSRVG